MKWLPFLFLLLFSLCQTAHGEKNEASSPLSIVTQSSFDEEENAFSDTEEVLEEALEVEEGEDPNPDEEEIEELFPFAP